MRTKQIKKCLIIFGLALVILSNFCYASDIGLGSLDAYGSGMAQSQRLKNMAGPIVTILQMVGSFASVIVLVVIGIKYMIGSVEEKAEYKRTLMPYIIGCAIVFGFSNLIGIIFNVATGLLK